MSASCYDPQIPQQLVSTPDPEVPSGVGGGLFVCMLKPNNEAKQVFNEQPKCSTQVFNIVQPKYVQPKCSMGN